MVRGLSRNISKYFYLVLSFHYRSWRLNLVITLGGKYISLLSIPRRNIQESRLLVNAQGKISHRQIPLCRRTQMSWEDTIEVDKRKGAREGPGRDRKSLRMGQMEQLHQTNCTSNSAHLQDSSRGKNTHQLQFSSQIWCPCAFLLRSINLHLFSLQMLWPAVIWLSGRLSFFETESQYVTLACLELC